ncbi:MAG: universal stress protein [Bacteroidales bacterium]|nr:universal stress protein [Bacteroidales bacterium]
MEKKLNNIVLVPTDFSEACNNAVNHAVEIAEFLNYKICLLHVINKDTKSYLKKENLYEGHIIEKLSHIASDIKENNKIDAEYISKQGSIFSTINEVSAEIGANLLVLGTHGMTGFQKLTGSYALKVILKSPTPVIVVQKRPFGKGYKNILFPISDFTEDRQKVQWAVFIAKKFGSTIHIYSIHESDKRMLSKIQIITKQIKEVFEKNNISYTIQIAEKHNNFAKQVVNYATTNNSDLIMIMTKPDVLSPDFNYGPWDEKIMFNTSQIPVMCVNPFELGNIYYEYPTLM